MSIEKAEQKAKFKWEQKTESDILSDEIWSSSKT